MRLNYETRGRLLISHSELGEVSVLAAFFERWRQLSRVEPRPSLEARLDALLAKLRPYLAPPDVEAIAAQPARALLEAESFKRLLGPLSTALKGARLQGALLNVWTIAGLRRDEVRNAAVLAAMFNPAESSDRAAVFLTAFLERVEDGEREHLPTPDELARGYSVQTEACPLGAADHRVDLSIEGPEFILLIEVKIDAGEGREQLARYESVLRRKAEALGKRAALVYLSPARPNALPAGAFYADWSTVVSAARAVVTGQSRADRSVQDLLLMQFAEHVRQFS